jgi:hypothetical protein
MATMALAIGASFGYGVSESTESMEALLILISIWISIHFFSFDFS